ncbi:MAG: transcriptional repressor [Desulfarculales bacterium]|nr:transcriptional repressor [Desulfarculales bacterium]
MPSELAILRQYISDNRMRYTPEREAIVNEIFSRHDHFNVEDLYQRLRGHNLPISRASVYRTIPLLLEAGLINQVFQENGQTYYEHIYGHERHCHLRCLSCGRIEEFMEPALSEVARRLGRQTGFSVGGINLEMTGLCPICRKKDGK